jgi:hypothetical protein
LAWCRAGITPTGEAMKNENKGTDKKKGTLRPWLVDVQVEHLR